MHNGMLNVDGEKMSKSLGNFLTVQDVLQKGPWAGEAFRLLLLKTHYRQPIDFSWDALIKAKYELDDFYELIRDTGAEGWEDAARYEPAPDLKNWLLEPLRDDLNTPLAVARLHELQDAFDMQPIDDPSSFSYRIGRGNGMFFASEAPLALHYLGTRLLGLFRNDPIRWRHGWTDAVEQGAIDAAIQARAEARLVHNFAEADRIRCNLASQGIILEDGPTGTTWRRA
jgi:cysteinyl-tRNA synthetase